MYFLSSGAAPPREQLGFSAANVRQPLGEDHQGEEAGGAGNHAAAKQGRRQLA